MDNFFVCLQNTGEFRDIYHTDGWRAMYLRFILCKPASREFAM